MRRFIEGEERSPVSWRPECLDAFIAADKHARGLDAFVAALNVSPPSMARHG
jgi:hypothetical protein